MKSLTEPEFVMLHLPLAVMRSFFPGWDIFSIMAVFAPDFAAAIPAMSPAGPAPIIIMSYFLFKTLSCHFCIAIIY